MKGRDLTNEDIVTTILTDREILKRPDIQDSNDIYATNPTYDLSSYLRTKKKEPGRFGPKYIFVK